ncbi:MAG TPA: ABC transporter substrate-binding protein [Geobacteraceae bacterium]
MPILTVLTMIVGPAVSTARAKPLDKVALQLKWKHQFQFAGYYAAQLKGFYRDEGLDVDIREGAPSISPIASLLANDCNFAISAADALLARLQGQPIVALAVIYQHSPYIYLTRDQHLSRPGDLVGHTIMLVPGQGQVELQALFRLQELPFDKLRVVKHSWDIEDLLAGRVDAMSAYKTDHFQALTRPGVTQPGIIRPMDYGIDFYGDTLITSEHELKEHPQRVAAFRRASLRGWEYAFAHEDELINAILAMPGVAARGITLEFLRHEAAEMRTLVVPDLVELGLMNRGRWQQMAETYLQLGLVDSHADLGRFIYDSNPQGGLTKQLIIAAGSVTLLACLALVWAAQLRRAVKVRTAELNREIERRTATETMLRERNEELTITEEELREQLDANLVIQQELERSAQSYQEIFNATSEAIFIHDATTGSVIDVNRAMLTMYGCTREEACSQDIGQFSAGIPPYSANEAGDWMRRASEIGPQLFEWHSRRYNGELFWTEITLKQTTIGGAGRTLAVVRDVTDRRATEESLRLSEERFHSLFRHMREGMAIHEVISDSAGTPLDYRLIDVNPAYETITGISREQAVGTLASELYGSGEPPYLEKFTQPVLTGQPLTFETYFPPMAKHFQISVFSPRPDQFATVFFDITARKQAEAALQQFSERLERRVAERTAQLEAANRELESFSYSVSHDLRAPLRHISSYSSALREDFGASLPEGAVTYLDRIDQSSRRMGRLIEALLKLAGLSRMPLQLTSVDLSALVREIMDGLLAAAPERQAQITIADGVTVRGDETLLRTALTNLLGNAWKFSQEREVTIIEFGVRTKDGDQIYFVRDNGAGFDMLYRDKLFGAFQRLHRADEFEGTGVGLATTQRLIHRHGGTIWAEGMTGAGATFFFTLKSPLPNGSTPDR